MATDFVVTNHGSLWTFTPLSPVARTRTQQLAAEAEADGEPLLRQGEGFAVDARAAPDLVLALRGEGFTLDRPR
jgi:hypothetical protein